TWVLCILWRDTRSPVSTFWSCHLSAFPVFSLFFFFFFKQKTAYEIGLGIPAEPLFRSVNLSTNLASHFFDLVIGKILTSRLSLSKHLAHNLGNLLLLGKIGVFHNRRNASSRLLLLISKHLILCIYLVFRIL